MLKEENMKELNERRNGKNKIFTCIFLKTYMSKEQINTCKKRENLRDFF